ncbi:MAG: ABC transporter permease subunit [Clostridiaceae bacterium]|nr:ABC transporter permease subunit [Clostridiaceae bacterium]
MKTAATPVSSGYRRMSPGKKKFLDSRYLLILVLPCILYLVLFNYVPIWGISISFMDYKPFLGVSGSTWVGAKHYIRFFTELNSWKLVRNTFLLSAYSLIISFPFTIFLALVVNEVRVDWTKKAFQTVSYMPHFISTVVIVGMLKSMLNPDSGLLMDFMNLFGFPRADVFTYPRYFRSLYIFSGIWQEAGWGAIIYYAALAAIDQELYEAAVIDGAGKLQQITHITLPCIAPTIVTLFVLRTGSLLSVGFEKAYLMQTTSNLVTSDVISTYVYRQGLAGSQFSYSTAVGLFNSLINLLFVVAANFVSRKLTDYSLW